ncbi:hypothetical protein [Halobacillus litoralis]|nr:hypothetical protein [Halobacillus litoralis]
MNWLRKWLGSKEEKDCCKVQIKEVEGKGREENNESETGGPRTR